MCRGLLALAIVAAACDGETVEPRVEPGGVLVVAPVSDPLTDRMVTSLSGYVEKLAGSKPRLVRLGSGSSDRVVDAAEDVRAGLVLVVDGQVVAGDLFAPVALDKLGQHGFRITVKDAGDWPNRLASRGATFVYLGAKEKLPRQYAVYEALRRLGARFYHPEQEYLPRNDPRALRDRVKRPTVIAADAAAQDYLPDFAHRSYTFHGAHPLEHLEAFSDGDHPIDEAERVNDWIVKNRGSRFRGLGRGVAGAAAREKRRAELEKLRRLLGFPTGAGITLHNQQQGASAVVDRSKPTPPKQQIEDHVAAQLKANPEASEFGVHFGPTEFTVTPDRETVDWINWAGRKALELRPSIRVIVNDHITGSQAVQSFGDLGCPTGTNTDGRCDYYDLAFHTDGRFAVKVHTVMFYPLEGPARVYNQKTFAHKLCLMKQASAKGRTLSYFPEGSWWLSFDNPIPVYLPLYIWARGRDVELVRPLLAARGGGTLDEHRMFNSGHEWGYWQQDYAVGLWHWNADVTLDEVLGEIADPFCEPGEWDTGCAAHSEAVAVLKELITHQRGMLLTRKDFRNRPGGLYAYLAGEDPADEIAAVTGLEFRPVRVSFSVVQSWDADQLEHFRDTDLDALKEMETAYAGWLARLKKIEGQVPQSGRPWLDEIVDGVEIDLLRARQARRLYDAVLTHREAVLAKAPDPRGEALPKLEAAEQALRQAELVIRRREKHYRYPAEQMYGGGLTPETAKQNGTTYPYRVHTKTHLLTYWHNRSARARDVLDGRTGGATDLVLSPTVAAPGAPLSISWPRMADLSADVTIGSSKLSGGERGLSLGQGEGFFAVQGELKHCAARPCTSLPVEGGVVRANRRCKSPPKSLTLIEPASPVAQSVLGPLFPAVRWAVLEGAEPQAVVFAPDLSGADDPSFRHVFRLPLATRSGGRFTTAPVSLPLPIPNPGTGSQELTLRVTGLVVAGTITPTGLASSVRLSGALSIADLVKALIDMAGFDEEGAHAVLGSVLGYDLKKPPKSAAFVGELAVSAE
jgi:hypothetical protein